MLVLSFCLFATILNTVPAFQGGSPCIIPVRHPARWRVSDGPLPLLTAPLLPCGALWQVPQPHYLSLLLFVPIFGALFQTGRRSGGRRSRRRRSRWEFSTCLPTSRQQTRVRGGRDGFFSFILSVTGVSIVLLPWVGPFRVVTATLCW